METEENQDTFVAPEVSEVSKLFPNYEIHSLIAQGGMGAIYHATQTSLDREVAIKILPKKFSNDADFSSSFEAEAKAMAKLNHSNLIAIYDFGEVDGMLFLVMEYISGKSLYEATHGRTLEPEEALELIANIGRGLHHAHSHDILHRDVKPANILLGKGAQPKIGDFGLARPIKTKVKAGESIFGTPGYTAPEILTPPHQFDQRSDIFSLGVMLYELLTGELPPEEGDPNTLFPDDVSEEAKAITLKAIAKNPADRYINCEEFIDSIDFLIKTPPVQIPTSPIVPTAPIVPTSPVVPTSPLTGTGPIPGTRPMPGAPGSSTQYIPQKKKPIGKIIVILLILILGAGAYFIFLKGPGSSDNTPDQDNQDNSATTDESNHESHVLLKLQEAQRTLIISLKQPIETFDLAAKENTAEFTVELKKLVKEHGFNVDAVAAAWAKNHHIIPDIIDTDLILIERVPELHRAHLDKQLLIKEALATAATKPLATFKKSLETMAKRHDIDPDTETLDTIKATIKLLEGEIKSTREFISNQSKNLPASMIEE